MQRLLSCFCLLLLGACPTTQDHGPRDDAGDDAALGADAMVSADASVDPGPDAGTDASEGRDAGPDPADAGGGDAEVPTGDVRVVYLGTSLRPMVRSELVDGSFVPVEHLRWVLSISAASTPRTFEYAPPTKEVGPCRYWPFTGTSWPPGTETPAEPVSLDPSLASLTIDGRPVPFEGSGALLIAHPDYVAGAEVVVTLRLPSGTIRRSFRADAIAGISAPAITAERDAYRGSYAPGEPLTVGWPLQYAADDAEIIVVGGDDSALWAECILSHDDRQLTFPWADVAADFIGTPGTMGNAIHVERLSRREEISVEGGVEVRLRHDRSIGFDLYPPTAF